MIKNNECVKLKKSGITIQITLKSMAESLCFNNIDEMWGLELYH